MSDINDGDNVEMNTQRVRFKANQPVPADVYTKVINEAVGRLTFIQSFMEDQSVLQPILSRVQKEFRTITKASRDDETRKYDWWTLPDEIEDYILDNVHRIVSTDGDDAEFGTRAMKRSLIRIHSRCANYAAEWIVREGIRDIMEEHGISGDLDLPDVAETTSAEAPATVVERKTKLH